MAKPLRVLFIVPRFGTTHRGVEAATKELIARLNKDRFVITVLSAPHTCDMESVHFAQVPVLHRERLNWLLKLPDFIRRMLGATSLGSPTEVEAFSLVRNARDLWHHQAFDLAIPCGGTWTYRFARRVARRVLGVGHSGPVFRNLRLSDHFVALTPFDEVRARSLCPRVPVTVIPNGVDTARFTPARSNHRSSKNGKVVLCVAALADDKRHDLLFDAVVRLPADVRVLCVGEGPMHAMLARHSLAREGRVEFRTVRYDRVHTVYHEADVFSLASPGEAFGIAFLEAMASGLSVVAHDGPRQRYVVDGAGVFCNVFDPQEYATAIRRALNARPDSVGTKAAARFDWNEIATKYTEVFKEVCGSRSESQ